jgi:hypothetical protein
MEHLSKDWITEKHIDFEYKKYLLLAYLSHVDECFRSVRLYPPLAELVEHYRMARQLKENKDAIASQFPKELTGFDAEKFRLNYHKAVSDDKLMTEIESILDFSLPRFEEWLSEGRQLYDFIEKEISLGSVGLQPIQPVAGYLFLRNAGSETRVYHYSVSIFEDAHDQFRALHTSYVRSYVQGLMYSYESIKSELLRERRDLPNPACYAAETDLKIPMEETFLPIAKRMLMREVASK